MVDTRKLVSKISKTLKLKTQSSAGGIREVTKQKANVSEKPLTANQAPKLASSGVNLRAWTARNVLGDVPNIDRSKFLTTYEARVRETIEQAFVDVEANRIAIGVQGFSKARSEALSLSVPKKLQSAMQRSEKNSIDERESFRKTLLEKSGKERDLLIFADSLGLPRPDANKNSKATYSELLCEKYPDLRVTCYSQRFWTTRGARKILTENPDLGCDSHFLLHLGLNDCANRMFLENQRISLWLMGAETRDRIVEFSRLYRKRILTLLPPNHYVPLQEFRENLEWIVSTLQARKAKRIILSTIILPPTRSWGSTPGINENFARYNLEIMAVAKNTGVVLLDFDRFVWEEQHKDALLPDGMHLAERGHEIMAEKCEPYFKS